MTFSHSRNPIVNSFLRIHNFGVTSPHIGISSPGFGILSIDSNRTTCMPMTKCQVTWQWNGHTPGLSAINRTTVHPQPPCDAWPRNGFTESGITVVVSRRTADSVFSCAICAALPFQTPLPVPTTQNLCPCKCQGCCSQTYEMYSMLSY